MKNFSYSLLLIVASTLFVQTTFGQSKFDKWTELKEFHGVMSQTFHPSEEGNLEPIKSRSSEMMQKAEALYKSKIPVEFDNQAVRDAVKKLAEDSKKLHELVVNKAADEVIKQALSDLHDTFHLIVEKCSKNEEHH